MKFALTCTIAILSTISLMAFPKYLERFTKDPLSSPQFQNRCATCHIDPKGGSPRNEFGQAFEANDFTITPDLRARFQERFQYPVQRNDMNFLVQHRFSAPLFNGSAGRLFGLDSTANIAFGFDYGISNRVMASVYRARSDRTIEMDITGDLFHQQRGDPISLAAK